MALQKGDPDEAIAVAACAYWWDLMLTYLQSMFIHAPGPALKFPPFAIDTSGKRPRFTHELTPKEQMARFQDEVMRHEEVSNRIVQDPTAAAEYVDKMIRAAGGKQ